MRQQTVDIIKDLVTDLQVVFGVLSVIDNGDNTYTLNTKNTWWLSVEDEITIDSNLYEIKDFVINKSITIQSIGAAILPTASSFYIDAANYIHGTLKMAGNEVDSTSDKTELCPFVYLFEIISDKKNTDEESMIDRETDLRLFFLNSVNTADWLTVDHYTYFVQPMQQMVDLFISKIKKSRLFTDEIDYECTPLINVSENGTQEQSIFDTNLSGIELRLFAKIRKGLTCSNIEQPESPATVVVTDGSEEVTLTIGQIYTCGTFEALRVSNSNDTFDTLITEDLELPNISVTDCDGTVSSVPSMEDVVCTIPEVNEWLEITVDLSISGKNSNTQYDFYLSKGSIILDTGDGRPLEYHSHSGGSYILIDYANTGVYNIRIKGSGDIEFIGVNLGGDSGKITKVTNIGSGMYRGVNMFYGCQNAIFTADDTLNVFENGSSTFIFCSLLVTPPIINTILLKNLGSMFRSTSLNADLGYMDLRNCTTMAGFAQYSNTWSTANYNASLMGWLRMEAGDTAPPTGWVLKSNVPLHAGSSVATGDGLIARNYLINTLNWAINDSTP